MEQLTTKQRKAGRYAAECPCCSGRNTLAISKGRAEVGAAVRSHRCLDCAENFCPDCADTAHRFASVETVLPHGITMEQIDVELRDRRSQWYRDHTPGARRQPSRYKQPDIDLHIAIDAMNHASGKRTKLVRLGVVPYSRDAVLRAMTRDVPDPQPEPDGYIIPHPPMLAEGSRTGLHGKRGRCAECGRALVQDIFGHWDHDDRRGKHRAEDAA